MGYMTRHSGTHIIKNTVMEQSLVLNKDLKPEHKKTTNRTTLSPNTDINSSVGNWLEFQSHSSGLKTDRSSTNNRLIENIRILSLVLFQVLIHSYRSERDIQIFLSLFHHENVCC